MSSEQKKNAAPLLTGSKLILGSLALNIFLVGMVVSSALHRDGPLMGPPFPPRAAFPIERLEASLSQDEVVKLRGLFKDATRNMQAHHDVIMNASQKIAGILREDKPDLKELQAATDELQSVGQDFHTSMSTLLQRVAVEFPLETRRKIADHVAHGQFDFPLHARRERPIPPNRDDAMPPPPPGP